MTASSQVALVQATALGKCSGGTTLGTNAVLAGDEVRLEHLSPAVLERRPASASGSGPAAEAGSIRDAVADLERRSIEAALASCSGNKSRAAKQLGISRFALQRKLDKYGLATGDDDPDEA